MTHRTDTILLDASVTRCNPTRPCSRKHHCARYLAAIPQGTPLQDFSSGNMYCMAYFSVESTKRQTVARKTTVHEAPEGLAWQK